LLKTHAKKGCKGIVNKQEAMIFKGDSRRTNKSAMSFYGKGTDIPPLFAFNVWSVASAQAVIAAAARCNRDVILQTSQCVFESMNAPEFRGAVKSLAKTAKIRAYLHLDHCRDVKTIKRAIELRWDSVMFDGSHLKISENIENTCNITALAHSAGVLVEAEVGQISGTEGDMAAFGNVVADPDDVERMLTEADADMLAVAVGTVHGICDGQPEIDFELLEKVNRTAKIPLVIHGGSGLDRKIITEILRFDAVKKINFSTDLKLAFKRGLTKISAFSENNDRNVFDPYFAEKTIYDEIINTVTQKLSLL
jgi:ketose-bisphosphate aldolase